MNRNRNVLILMVVFIFLLTSCGVKIASPGDAITPPDTPMENTLSSTEIMSGYSDLISKSSSPGELMKYIEDNIGNLGKEDADAVVLGLITVQKTQLKIYRDKIYSQEIAEVISQYLYEDIIALRNIKEEDIKILLENAKKDGYKVVAPEGMYDFELDFATLNDKFSSYSSEEFAAYLEIMSDESKAHYLMDGSLSITLDQLAHRIINTENFDIKFTNSQFHQEIGQLYINYLTAYLIGLNNTPAFSYEDNTLKPENLANFKSTMTQYKGSELSGILEEYISLLEKNDNKKTQAVLDFVTQSTVNP